MCFDLRFAVECPAREARGDTRSVKMTKSQFHNVTFGLFRSWCRSSVEHASPSSHRFIVQVTRAKPEPLCGLNDVVVHAVE